MERPKFVKEMVELGQNVKRDVVLAFNIPYSVSTQAVQGYETRNAAGLADQNAGYIKNNLRKINLHGAENSYGEEEVFLRSAQYRALNYLYGEKENVDRDSIPKNPLVDVLVLISNSRHDNRPTPGYVLTTEGPPLKTDILGSENWVKKERQFADKTSKTGEKQEFRTIGRLGETLPTTIRGLSLIARVTDKYPEILEPTLQEYVTKATGGQGNVEGTALGLLDIIQNLDLLYDERFINFSSNLRGVVLDKFGSLGNLREKYHYRVVTNTTFWSEGEEKVEHQKTILYGKIRRNSERGHGETFLLPRIENWDESVRARSSRLKTIDELTLYNSFSGTTRRLAASDTLEKEETLDEYADDIRATLRRKAQLKEMVRQQNHSLTRGLKKNWSEFCEGAVNGRRPMEDDKIVMRVIVREVMTLFSEDTSLSQKTSSRIAKRDGKYEIKEEELLGSPLYAWVFSLRNGKFADSLERTVETQPAEFSLLLRLMTYEVASKYFSKKETDFLLDPDYSKIDPEKLISLVKKVREIVNLSSPDLKGLFIHELSKRDEPVEDVLKPSHIKRLRQNLKSLHFNEPIPFAPAISFDKSKQITRRDFLKLLLYGGGGAIGGTAIIALSNWLSNQASERGTSNLEPPDLLSELQALSNYTRRIQKSYDNTPDLIDRRSLERIRPSLFGNILNLPRSYFSGYQGEQIGYFPNQIMTDDPNNPDFANHDVTTVMSDENVEIVNSVDDFDVSQYPDLLVIRPTEVAQVNLAPVGWRISKVIQEGGMIPSAGRLGQVYYHDYSWGLPPKNAIFLYEKIPNNELTPFDYGLLHLKNVGFDSNSTFSIDRAMLLNDQLKADPRLQDLHKNFITEVEDIWRGVTSENNTESISKLNNVAMKYTAYFKQYILENRYYALGFSVASSFDETDQNPNLRAIAESPDKGFYCTVAAYAYKEFMQSGGFSVYDQPGFHLRNYDDQLWGDIGHMNSILVLYDGSGVYADMTPPVTEKTPPEDIQALEDKIPNDVDKAREGVWGPLIYRGSKAAGALVGAGIALTAAYVGAGMAAHEISKRHADKFLEETKELSPFEQEVLAATVGELAFLPYDRNFYESSERIMGTINDFDPGRHEDLVKMLLDQYAPFLLGKKENLLTEVFGEQDQEEMLTMFLKRFSQKRNTQRLAAEDFDTAFQIARILAKNQGEFLKKRVLEKLGQNTDNRKIVRQSIFKSADLKEMAREWIYEDTFKFPREVSKNSAAYFKVVYDTFEGIYHDNRLNPAN